MVRGHVSKAVVKTSVTIYCGSLDFETEIVIATMFIIKTSTL